MRHSIIGLAQGVVDSAYERCESEEFKDFAKEDCLVSYSNAPFYLQTCALFERYRDLQRSTRDPETRFYIRKALSQAQGIIVNGGVPPC